jgi:uncharacterized phage infection (PIP) family protein YhgE
MLDENLIATLEQSLQQTRSNQNRLMARLREVEDEARNLRKEIEALEKFANQTESNIDGLLVTMRAGNRIRMGNSLNLDDDYERQSSYVRSSPNTPVPRPRREQTRTGSVAYLNQNRGGVPRIQEGIEAISHRFSDRTITQACTLLLREAGKPLHVNELYNLLVAGGMEFKGNNPTISIAVSLHRNRRFRKVEPGTFDLVMREASQAAS